MTEKDSIDRHIALWKREVPGLDPVVEGAVVRMQVLVQRMHRLRARAVAAQGLKPFEFDILWHLRSLGSPYRGTPTLIAERTDIHPATLTSRLDRLEQAGFVIRLHDPGDRRRLLVELTDQAHEALEASIGVNSDAEKELLSALTRTERTQLSGLLRKLVLAVESEGSRLLAVEDD
ncbi:MarR family winged helix-turn-helix transcriptional regulator [Microlunatus speluncae]|uniref:MarR family winged helix-turn-helix transcriptional regulator n=1 Tax=Microlunatus speluncae TaxID=2594267 RepID=UPI00126646B5|nr:MarR family transcriptional regulator [Microlunatus speluncae]